MSDMRGVFISLEGVEGVGKSTNVAFTADAARGAGYDVVTTREPGGTELGELIREWILHGSHGRLSPEVEVLLMFAARARHLDEVVRPALAAGRCVVCDRFTDATFAYQGAGRGASRELLETLRMQVQQGLEPDLTLLLDAPLDVGARRIGNREPDHFEREQRPFFERVRAEYLSLAAQHPGRFRIIDAAVPLPEVRRQIEAQVAALFERLGTGRA
jgi:dTMP kinase